MCPDHFKFNELIDCPWQNPHDKAKCLECKAFYYFKQIFCCDCNRLENMTCEGGGYVFYGNKQMLLKNIFLCNSYIWFFNIFP